jgi:hypothetical protein
MVAVQFWLVRTEQAAQDRTMKIQLATASFQTDPSDYWNDVSTEVKMVSGHEEEFDYKEFDSIAECWNECDRHTVVVSKTNIYKEECRPDDLDFCVKVYDDRME